MATLREFLYDNVYRSPRVHKEFLKAKKILTELYRFFLENESMLAKTLEEMEMPAVRENGDSQDRIACDLIASLTDTQALDLYRKIFFPSRLV
jgi:dGTPase